MNERLEGSIKERSRTDIDFPKQYEVLMHNDDFTTMDFVIRVLKEIFFKSDAEAESLMMKIHQSGKAVVGIYSLDIAQSKINKTTRLARAEGFPLRLSMNPVE